MSVVFDFQARHASFVSAARGPIIMNALIGALNPDDIDVMEFQSRPLRERYTRMIFLTYARGKLPLPDKETRARAAAQKAKQPPGALDIIVMESTGLWASAARGVLTGIYILSGQSHGHKIVATLDEAAHLIAKELPADLTETQKLLAAFSAFLDDKSA